MNIEFTDSYKKFAIKVSLHNRKPAPFDLDDIQKVVVKFENGCVILNTNEKKSRKILISPDHYSEVIEED